MNARRSISRTRLSISGGGKRRSSNELSIKMTLHLGSLKVKAIKMKIMISQLGASRRSSASQTTMMKRVKMKMASTTAGAFGRTQLTSLIQPREPISFSKLNRSLSLSPMIKKQSIAAE